MMTLDQLLDLAVKAGFKRIDRPGMADIYVQYRPYEARWQAQASWDDGDTETATSNDAQDAMDKLGIQLNRVIEKYSDR